MRKFSTYIVTALGAAFALAATPAAAQFYVATTGDDAANCLRETPCRTLPRALEVADFTFATIDILDSGRYDSGTFLDIERSVTIRAVGVVAMTNGVTRINAPGTARVVLEGLHFKGAVEILNGRDTIILDCTVEGGTNQAAVRLANSSTQAAVTIQNSRLIGKGYGVRVTSGPGLGTVRIVDTLIQNMDLAGVSITGAGNRVEIQGSEVFRTPKSLDIQNGAVVYSYGDNVLSAGDAPTPIPKS